MIKSGSQAASSDVSAFSANYALTTVLEDTSPGQHEDHIIQTPHKF